MFKRHSHRAAAAWGASRRRLRASTTASSRSPMRVLLMGQMSPMMAVVRESQMRPDAFQSSVISLESHPVVQGAALQDRVAMSGISSSLTLLSDIFPSALGHASGPTSGSSSSSFLLGILCSVYNETTLCWVYASFPLPTASCISLEVS